MKRSSETAPRIGAARSEAGRVLGEVSGSDRNADARLGASRNWRMRRMRKRGDTERREDKEIRGYELGIIESGMFLRASPRGVKFGRGLRASDKVT